MQPFQYSVVRFCVVSKINTHSIHMQNGVFCNSMLFQLCFGALRQEEGLVLGIAVKIFDFLKLICMPFLAQWKIGPVECLKSMLFISTDICRREPHFSKIKTRLENSIILPCIDITQVYIYRLIHFVLILKH